MTKFIVKITGIRHHDFKDRLEELYQSALGRRMSIAIEPDNVSEKDAIIVYWGNSLVGYVRSGKDRELALSIIRASGRESLLGKIVAVDRQNRWLSLELNCKNEPKMMERQASPILADWSFDGKTLPIDEPEVRLHTMLCNLEGVLEDLVASDEEALASDQLLEPWDEDMEQWTQYIERNLWRDISLETSVQIDDIFALLTQGSNRWKKYEKVSNRLQFAIDAQGSPEVRQIQAKQILQKAHSKEMDALLLHYGDSAKESVEKLPETMRNLFLADGEQCMARLWYQHRPRKQVNAIKTLLALMMRLKDDETSSTQASQTASDTRSIPESWLLAWGTNQGDKVKAQLIKDIILSFETESTNAKLNSKVQTMMDSCNTPMRQIEAQREQNEILQKQNKAVSEQTDALKAVAERPTIQAEHYHADGSEYNDNSKTMNLPLAGAEDANRLISNIKKDNKTDIKNIEK